MAFLIRHPDGREYELDDVRRFAEEYQPEGFAVVDPQPDWLDFPDPTDGHAWRLAPSHAGRVLAKAPAAKAKTKTQTDPSPEPSDEQDDRVVSVAVANDDKTDEGEG